MAGRVREADRAANEKQALGWSVTAGWLAKLATKVVTVTGEISPEELTICDAHNHIWIEPVTGAGRDAPVLDDRQGILGELIEYKDAGGDALADCQPGGCGRNSNRLRNLWPLIEKMAAEGLCEYVALATDMAEKALWRGGWAATRGWRASRRTSGSACGKRAWMASVSAG